MVIREGIALASHSAISKSDLGFLSGKKLQIAGPDPNATIHVNKYTRLGVRFGLFLRALAVAMLVSGETFLTADSRIGQEPSHQPPYHTMLAPRAQAIQRRADSQRDVKWL